MADRKPLTKLLNVLFSARRGLVHLVSMLPMLLAATAALLFVVFLLAFYEGLFVKSWMAEARYGFIVSHAAPYLELSAFLLAGSFALLRPNRNRLIFGAVGAAVVSYAIVNTVRYADLNALTWQGWAQGLFIQIVVPLSLGILMIVGIPFIEEASRMGRTEKLITGLSSSIPNLEHVVEEIEGLSKRLEDLSSIRYPTEELASLRGQVQSMAKQVRELKADMGELRLPAALTGQRTVFQGVTALSPRASRGLARTRGEKTQVNVPNPRLGEAAGFPTSLSPRVDAGKPSLPECARDNPWMNILAERKEVKRPP
ncbi:MAG: hypothetical protein QW587_02080 [Candidatus Bathyarchaeia archaeon]